MSRLISSPAASLQKVGVAPTSVSSLFSPITRSMSAFKKVSHVIFDMDGLLLGEQYIFISIGLFIWGGYNRRYKKKLLMIKCYDFQSDFLIAYANWLFTKYVLTIVLIVVCFFYISINSNVIIVSSRIIWAFLNNYILNNLQQTFLQELILLNNLLTNI